jgi:hypothetical protein
VAKVNDCQIGRAAIEALPVSYDNGFAATSPRAVLSVVGNSSWQALSPRPLPRLFFWAAMCKVKIAA